MKILILLKLFLARMEWMPKTEGSDVWMDGFYSFCRFDLKYPSKLDLITSVSYVSKPWFWWPFHEQKKTLSLNIQHFSTVTHQ